MKITHRQPTVELTLSMTQDELKLLDSFCRNTSYNAAEAEQQEKNHDE